MPPLPSVLPITAMTRSASMTPSSMSLASSEASLTLCRGTLRTSIGAGTASPSGGEDGAGVVPTDGVGDVFQGRDDGSAWSGRGPAGLHEAEDGVDLRAHAAARELALRGVRLQFGDRHPPQRAPGRRPEVDHDVRDVGGDDEGVGVELGGQDRGGEVLVDDGLDTAQRGAVPAVVRHRDAAAPGADDDEAGRGERMDGGGVDDGLRLRRGDDAAPALLAAVLPDLPERDEPFRLL